MKLEAPVQRHSLKAAAAVTRGRFVTFAGAAPTAGGNAAGPAWTDAKKDEHVAVTLLGIAVGVTGSTVAATNIAQGDGLKVEATGKLIKAGQNDTVVARALEAATEKDKDIQVFVVPN